MAGFKATMNFYPDEGHDLNPIYEIIANNAARKTLTNEGEERMIITSHKIRDMMIEGMKDESWEAYFPKMKTNVLGGIMRTQFESTKRMCLRILMKMCEKKPERLAEWTEEAILTVLTVGDGANEAVTEVEVHCCLRELTAALSVRQVINVVVRTLHEKDLDEKRATDIISVLTFLFETREPCEVRMFVDTVAPKIVEMYPDASPSLQKTIVDLFVAMVVSVGNRKIQKHFMQLPNTTVSLIQYFARRSKTVKSR